MKIIDSPHFPLPGSIKRILLIQLGDIGDVVWTTPSIKAVKSSIPRAKVSVLVKEGFGGLLEADPSVTSVFEVTKTAGSLFKTATRQMKLIRDMRAHAFDMTVDLRLGDRGAWMAFLSGAPLRITLNPRAGLPLWRRCLFTHAVEDRPPVSHRGAVDQSLRILKPFGIDTDEVSPRLWVSGSVRSRVRQILTEQKMDGLSAWVSVNPYSRWSYKEWSDAQWIDLFNWLWEECALPAVIIGSKQEWAKAEALSRQSRGRTFNLAGHTSLAELAGLLAESRLHIGVDSATPHIAAALGTPTVTIYGPTSWQDWAPTGNDHRVVVPDRDCVPCRRKGCDNTGRSLCLETLTAQEVKPAIRQALAVPRQDTFQTEK